MESFSGDTEESTEDIQGRKKSKLKSLKTRLFRKTKRAGGEGDSKLSQSASDITAGKELGSDEDLVCPQGMMGSRALSHDSIFLADQVLTDTEPARVLSQENVHSKIKALQMKLQQQKMHLGPPPMVVPIRRPEDPGSHAEDCPPHSPLDISGGDTTSQGALTKTIFQPASRPLSPIPRSAPTKSPPTPSHSFPLSAPSNSSSSAAEAPLDFSTPAQFTPCLDTSAARHRMSVKPRNQRASTKKKPPVTGSHLNTLNNTDYPESAKDQEQQLVVQDEVTAETEQGGIGVPITSERLPSKTAEVALFTTEATPKSSSSSVSSQDHALPGTVASQILRVKPNRRVDARPSERPHSSFIESELKEKREGDFEIQVMSHDKRDTLHKAGITEASPDQHSTLLGSAGEIKRPAPGSGSFHFSITTAKNRDGERPRSGSFVGVLEQTEVRHKTIGGTEEKSTREKEELRGFQPRGGPFSVGRLRQEGAPPRCSVIPWDKRDSLKKVESATVSKNVPTDTGAVEAEEVESSQEQVEEAVEAKEVQEEEGRTTFGVKLRSTSQSIKLRSDAASNHQSKTLPWDDQSDKQKTQEISDNGSYTSEKLPENMSCTQSASREPKPTDPIPSVLSLPVKRSAPFPDSPYIRPTEVQTIAANPKEAEATPKEPQPAPQTASSELSWMSLAMEKTSRSLQQLFTSRFPRDFTGNLQANVQTAGRPQAQVQPTNQMETVVGTQMQTQTVKTQQSATHLHHANQPSADTVKAETIQSRIQAQTVKPSPMAVQQKAAEAFPVQSISSREPQTSKQSSEDQSQPNMAQSVSHAASPPAVQTVPWTNQSPLRSSSQAATTSQFAQGGATQSLAQSYLSSGQQQPSWSNRGLHTANQLKSPPSALTSVSTVSSAEVPPSVSALGRGERETTVQKEGPPLSTRRAVWSGSVSEKAAFLEKRAEWTTPPGAKGVELRKAQTEMQPSGEPTTLAKTTPLSKDTVQEGRQGVKLAESSPTKVTDRPREDKWLRKNVPSSLSPSSSPTMPTVLQSMSESGQPSWMELAKRKSMAWSDKTMD